METLTGLLLQLRERLGLSQVDLSHRAGLSETYYGKIESGERRPSAKVLMSLLSVLQCSTEETAVALRLFAADRFPTAFLNSLAGALPSTRPSKGTARSSVVPSPKQRRSGRRAKLAAWLLVAGSAGALGQPLRVEASRLITDLRVDGVPSRGILSRSRRRLAAA